jgi:hypothetical protein
LNDIPVKLTDVVCYYCGFKMWKEADKDIYYCTLLGCASGGAPQKKDEGVVG